MTDISQLRIFLCLLPTKMTYSFDTLMGMAEEIFDQDPLSGHLFLFVNRCRDRIKILFWDRDGFCIVYKRLEVGTFALPRSSGNLPGLELEYSQLAKLLDGVDFQSGRRRKRYRRVG